MGRQNQAHIIFAALGGALMLFGSIGGSIIDYLLLNTTLESVGNDIVFTNIIIFLFVLSMISNSGGIAIIIGVLLISIDRYRSGKALTVLGTGLGFMGIITVIFIALVTGNLLGIFTQFVINMSTLRGIISGVGFLIAAFNVKEIRRPKRRLINIRLLSYKKEQDLSKYLSIGMVFFFGGVIETLFISVFSRLFFLDPYTYVFWQLGIISAVIILACVNYNFKSFRLTFFATILAITTGLLIFIFQLHSLLLLKISLIILFILSFIGNYITLKYIKIQIRTGPVKGGLLIIAFLIFFGLSVLYLTNSHQRIMITPKTEPELIFFTSPSYMPDDNETYEQWGDDKISFFPSIGLHTLNDTEKWDRYKLAIQNEVNLYFNLIVSDFANIYTTGDIIDVYKAYRERFIAEGIFDSKYIKAFTVDAEPSKSISKNMQTGTLQDGMNYLLDHFPSKEEIDKATEDLEEFIDMVHEDDKEVGIIRTRTNYDGIDSDGDVELLSQNIYSLDVQWDFSVSMLYRSQKIQESEEGSANQIISDVLSTVYGATSTENAFVYSRFYFYLYVGATQSQTDINSKEHYIFLGNYKSEFERTSYIKNKEFFIDLDICRHFSEEKVFFYNYEGFLYHFGDDGICDIIEHNKQKESWILEYENLEAQAHITLLMLIVFVDWIMGLELTNS